MHLAYSIGRYRTDKKRYPESVRDLRGRDLKAYGRQYLEEAAAFRATDRPFFTDKMPNNFSHVGLIHLILPNAKIINARRHPFDSCLGGYKQLFAKGQHFTYDMAELAAYYRQYHETMRYWHRVLPGKVLDVHYEETVTDLETQVRRILAHCGLPFEEACVRFHENTRAVKTASSEQVRQPIYTDALGYWRRYEKLPRHLAAGARRYRRRAAGDGPQRRALRRPAAHLSRMATRRVRGWRCGCPCVRLTDSSRWFDGEIVDRDSRWRGAAGHDGVRQHAQAAREALAGDADSRPDRGSAAAPDRNAAP